MDPRSLRPRNANNTRIPHHDPHAWGRPEETVCDDERAGVRMFADESVEAFAALAFVVLLLIATIAMGVAAGRRR
ncbi:hypothetical protein GCM10009750_06420 [Agromyces salentinus]|uniref:Uncharacterized protein n=1 Tax=Agromyces salentinus TaxID=269421 RepID=A0ABN2MFX0_9MICO